MVGNGLTFHRLTLVYLSGDGSFACEAIAATKPDSERVAL
jgi:hypothetical protein